MKNRECVSCIKRKTPYCPTSIECMATEDMPYYQNRMMLLKENQELKKQLEDKEDYINKLQATKDKLDKRDYENTMQQKEFIKYLEDEIKDTEKTIELLSDTRNSRIPILQYKKHIIEVILAKYKEIIGVSNDY